MLAIADQRHRLTVARAELDKLGADLDLAERREQIAHTSDPAEQCRGLLALDPQQRSICVAEIAAVSGERFIALVNHCYDASEDALLELLERQNRNLVDLQLAELPDRVRVRVAHASAPQVVTLAETVLVADEPELILDASGAVIGSIPRTRPKTVHRKVARNRAPAIIASQVIEVTGASDPRLVRLAELHVTGALASLVVEKNEYGVTHVITPTLADGTIHQRAIVDAVLDLLPSELRALVSTEEITERESRDAFGTERGRRSAGASAYPMPPLKRRARRGAL